MAELRAQETCDEVLSQILSNITYEHKMEMQNAPLFCWIELLPSDIIQKAVEKLSRVLCDEAVKKAVSLERRPSAFQI